MSEPLLTVRLDSGSRRNRVVLRARDGLCFRLTPDEAQRLSNDLQDAVDELAGWGQS